MYSIDINEIINYLPHRAPFLFVDRILSIELGTLDSDQQKPKEMPPYAPIGTKVRGQKNVTYNEPFFPGHFPGFSIMPGVLLIEAMAQVASFTVYPSFKGKLDLVQKFQCILVGIEKTKFRKPITPGDVLILQSELLQVRKELWWFQCNILVENKVVAESELVANLKVVTFSSPKEES